MDLIRSHVMVCGGTNCSSTASAKIIAEFEKQLAAQGMDKEAQVVRTGCFGMCEAGPVVIVYPEGAFYAHMTVENVARIVDEHLIKGRVVKELLYKEAVEVDNTVKSLDNVEFYKKQKRVALRNCGVIDPENIEEYIAFDGYKALGKVLTEMTPQDVIDVILKSGLRGRGGAGFPTGMKWKFAAASQSDKKYVCCNADEGDPGAFMDRSVLEGDPHVVVEAMAIAAYAIGADQGYIYCRAEYPIAVKRLQIAIRQAREYGLLGKNIFGTGFNFDVEVRLGAGAFVCGEETALMTSIEGKRRVRVRRSQLSRVCLISRPSSTTWKPMRMCRRLSTTAGNGSLRWARRNRRAPRYSRWAAKSATPVWWKFLWALRCARLSTKSAAAVRTARSSRRRRRADLPAAAFLPAIWMCRLTMTT